MASYKAEKSSNSRRNFQRTICKDRFPLPKKCREGRPESETNDDFKKWNTNFRLEHSIEKNRATFCRCPVVPSWSDPKRHVPLTFQRSFQKTIVNGKQPQSRFPAHEGKFSLFPSSSPKRIPTISFQCLQTNTSQIAGFLTCSLSTFLNTRRKISTGQIQKRIFETLKRST